MWKEYAKENGNKETLLSEYCLLVLSPVGVKICVGECVRIPTYSMYPTLLPGDIAWCEKMTYGPLLPERISELPILNLLCFFPRIQQLDKQLTWKSVRLAGIRTPKRLDVVVFDAPGSQMTLT
ncbi:signal peptidase I [gut metagenome]|uniref:Signal peptidase I n=1 Tax=gut metagenome TaxID=749906 RepID=J9GC54_9ZZZZ